MYVIRMIKSRRMRWVRNVARMGEKRKHEGKTLLRNSRRRWEHNIKIYLRKIRWGGTDWIHLAQDRAQWQDSCEHGNEPLGSIKYWEIL
jgi:hypothetical protein